VTLAAHVDVQLDTFQMDVELTVETGHTVAVVGPNGAGKTTLLRVLAGLTALRRGHITIDGAVVDDPDANVFVPPERRPVAVVFQDHLLFPHLRAVDNVAFGLRARGVRRRDARARALAWLERVQLADKADAYPRELSGGQGQRVALARALAMEPVLLLLDEPMAALDVTVRAEVRRDLRRHLETFDGVRIVVTHDPIDAAVLSDEVVVLEGGRVTQRGTPAAITARPRSRWVADLIGTNLLRGTNEGGVIHVDGGGTLTASPADDTSAGPVLAVIPPRAVALHRHRPDGTPRNVWLAKVHRVEPMIDGVRVQLVGPPDIIAEITPQSTRELDLVEGREMWVAIKATEITTSPA
jgi:molybdate transport system ATP-binding protein